MTLRSLSFALLPILLLACGDSASSGDVADSGAGGTKDGEAAHDSGGGTTHDSGAAPDAGGDDDTGDDDAGGSGDDDDAQAEAGPPETPTTKAVMYVDNWSGSFASWATKIDFTKLTHLNLAFATVSGGNNWGTSLGSTSDVKAIVSAAHAKNVKVLASLGGGGGDQSVIAAYQNESNIGPLVDNLDAMVHSMDLDGVDVDLESGGQMKSSSNFPAFVKALIAKFHPQGKLVTTALAQYIVQDMGPNQEIVDALNSFDFVNDMIYSANLNDFNNEAHWWTGSPVNLPKEKLVWGVCFDGECGNPSVSVLKQITTASKDYGGIMIWDYTDGVVPSTMWPAIQGEL